MMKWVVKFIDENKNKWESRRREEILQRKRNEEIDEWKTLERKEKIEKLKKEKKIKLTKEEKIEKALKMKENWKRRGDTGEHDDKEAETEMADQIEEEIENLDMAHIAEETEVEETLANLAEKVESEAVKIAEEEVDEPETNLLLEMTDTGICGLCAHIPCLCLLLKVELKIKSLRDTHTPDHTDFHQTTLPANSDYNQGPPDDSSPLIENAQGLPPMLTKHEGSLGEVTKGWGSDLTNPPPSHP